MRIRAPVLVLAPVALVSAAASTARGDSAAPPPTATAIEDEYADPRAHAGDEDELGAAANQVRLVALVGGSLGAVAASVNDVLGVGQGTLEYVAIPWLGVRASSELAVPVAGGAQPWSFRLGPSLHLLPYRRVDVGAFFEGGVAAVDLLVAARRAAMPVVAAGGVVDVALTSSWLLRLEGHLTGGVADRSGAASTYGYATGLLGIGWVL